MILWGECEDQYRNLVEEVLEQFQPEGPIETALANQLIVDIWRLQQLNRGEYISLKKAHFKEAFEDTHRYRFKADDQALGPPSKKQDEAATLAMQSYTKRVVDDALEAVLTYSVRSRDGVELSLKVDHLRQRLLRRICSGGAELERLRERRESVVN